MRFYEIERKSKPLRRTVKLAIFPKQLTDFWEYETTSSSVEFPVNTDCYLAKVEEIRIDVSNELQG
jgi:hypothetical protein